MTGVQTCALPIFINAVIVVPILAPIITEAACVSVISPTFTKPTIITVVADELVTIAVTAAPVPTPKKRFLVAFDISLRIDLPAAVSRLVPIIFIPIMKAATPPNSNSILLTIVSISDAPRAKTEFTINFFRKVFGKAAERNLYQIYFNNFIIRLSNEILRRERLQFFVGRCRIVVEVLILCLI